MIIYHYDRIERIHAEQQQILDESRLNLGRAKSRGISDELMKDLARSSVMLVDDVGAIAEWTVHNSAG